jgi:hypothetical protein
VIRNGLAALDPPSFADRNGGANGSARDPPPVPIGPFHNCRLAGRYRQDVPPLEITFPQPRRFEDVSVSIDCAIVREALDLVHAYRLPMLAPDRIADANIAIGSFP